jgi:sortase A
MIEWLRGRTPQLRYLAYFAGALLAFFVAFGVGAAAALVVGWQHGQVANGSGVPTDEPKTLEESVSETTGTVKSLKNTATETLSKPKNANPDEPAEEASFAHRATDENSRGDYTYISHPSINGDAKAIVLAAPGPDRESARGATYDHNIGVWYEGVDEKKWAIFNQDLAAVPAGVTFEVVVPPASGSFVHHAEPGNTVGNGTYLNDPLTAGKPGAVLSVTQNWNPGGGRGVYNDHPVGVRYDDERGQWAIYNKDRSAMPDGAAFNVAVSEAGKEATRSDVNFKEESKLAERTTPDTSAADPEEASEDSEGLPEYRDFYSEGDPETSAELISSSSSTGAIPAIKPFNFGRDPGGPKDKTLYLTIPALGLTEAPVFDTVSEEKLKEGTVHIPATGYPWQKGANVFIAGHRVGYPNTGSYYVFFRLDELSKGDEIELEDSAGGHYLYRVTKQLIVGANSVEVMNAVEDNSLITLQTCTLPDYEKRLIVQGELVEKAA